MLNSDYLRISTLSPAEISAELKQRITDQKQTRYPEKEYRYSASPAGWTKPRYNSPEYNKALSCGWISWEEAESDHKGYDTRRRRSLDTTWRRKSLPRHNRPAPVKNGQFVREMSTEAARDQRLKQGAKALLTIIIAYSGKKGWWNGTKTFLAVAMGLTPRTIESYLANLADYGYLAIDIEQNGYRGMVTGLVIHLTDKAVAPFKRRYWQEKLAKWGEKKHTLNNPQGGISLIKYSRSRWRSMCLDPIRYGTAPLFFS